MHDSLTWLSAGARFIHHGNLLAAEVSFRRAIDQDPCLAEAWYNLGWVLDEIGRLAEALAAFQRATALAPTWEDAQHNLALVRRRVRAGPPP